MSRENVERIRRTTEFFNANEIERALDEVSDDFEMDWSNSIGPLKGDSTEDARECSSSGGPSWTRGVRSNGIPKRSSRWMTAA